MLAEANACFLPPVSIEGEVDDWQDSLGSDGYFSPAYVHLRRSLLSVLGPNEYSGSEPSLVAISRVLNDPLLRDIFLDGGILRLIGDNTEATRWTIQFLSSGSVAKYRARVFLRHNDVQVCDWTDSARARVGGCLLEDLRALAPFSAPPGLCEHRMDWSVAEAALKSSSRAKSLHHEGSYQQIVALGKRLEDNEERDAFQQLVTWGASPVDRQSPDHDLAERNLVRRFFRCPWVRPPGPPWEMGDDDWGRAWIDAIRELLTCDFDDKQLSLESRVAEWSDRNCRLVPADGTAIVYHSYKAEQTDTFKWRLLAPLGTVFRADRTMCLDDPIRSRLDMGFVLG